MADCHNLENLDTNGGVWIQHLQPLFGAGLHRISQETARSRPKGPEMLLNAVRMEYEYSIRTCNVGVPVLG